MNYDKIIKDIFTAYIKNDKRSLFKKVDEFYYYYINTNFVNDDKVLYFLGLKTLNDIIEPMVKEYNKTAAKPIRFRPIDKRPSLRNLARKISKQKMTDNFQAFILSCIKMKHFSGGIGYISSLDHSFSRSATGSYIAGAFNKSSPIPLKIILRETNTIIFRNKSNKGIKPYERVVFGIVTRIDYASDKIEVLNLAFIPFRLKKLICRDTFIEASQKKEVKKFKINSLKISEWVKKYKLQGAVRKYKISNIHPKAIKLKFNVNLFSILWVNTAALSGMDENTLFGITKNKSNSAVLKRLQEAIDELNQMDI